MLTRMYVHSLAHERTHSAIQRPSQNCCSSVLGRKRETNSGLLCQRFLDPSNHSNIRGLWLHNNVMLLSPLFPSLTTARGLCYWNIKCCFWAFAGTTDTMWTVSWYCQIWETNLTQEHRVYNWFISSIAISLLPKPMWCIGHALSWFPSSHWTWRIDLQHMTKIDVGN